jgi:hypothetical protein
VAAILATGVLRLRQRARRRATKIANDADLRRGSLCVDLDWVVMKCLEKQRDRRDEGQRGAIVQTLEHWKRDPDLAGVRETKALAALPLFRANHSLQVDSRPWHGHPGRTLF